MPTSTQNVKANGNNAKEVIKHNKLEFEEMRRKLLITEQRLRSLSRLEDEVQSVVSTTSSMSGWESRSNSYRHPGSQQSDIESAPSAIGTVPNSYSGFDVFKVPSSTPSKIKHHSKKNHSIEEDSLDSESDSVTGSSLKENDPGGGHRGQNLPSKHERKLLKQNQRLLCEVERLVGELHQAKQETVKLEHLVEPARRVPDLEDRLEGSLAESLAQEKALREAEQHIEEGAKRNAELLKKFEQVELEVADLKSELEQVRTSKRDKANLEIDDPKLIHQFCVLRKKPTNQLIIAILNHPMTKLSTCYHFKHFSQNPCEAKQTSTVMPRANCSRCWSQISVELKF
ncbi:hypothetical protein RRG08_052608 [Elysia crispata]|uniref:Uncharacterized protein n=1 Tax=Elysia crispata TaxID=231223 RepID=A0AAE1A1X5_9GAST|nr:hypothetical protein RRG08_052608 [Elysia crispata]